MTVEFRLLGDVEARLDGQRLDIGHARQRCVLAALLVDVNRPVLADQLIDRVWADDTPHRARNALAGYLRGCASCSPTPTCRSSGEPRGLHAVDRCASVDIHRFRHMVAQARATDDPAEAAALFDGALDLWRGKAVRGAGHAVVQRCAGCP